jgi:hypothetical protein
MSARASITTVRPRVGGITDVSEHPPSTCRTVGSGIAAPSPAAQRIFTLSKSFA